MARTHKADAIKALTAIIKNPTAAPKEVCRAIELLMEIGIIQSRTKKAGRPAISAARQAAIPLDQSRIPTFNPERLK